MHRSGAGRGELVGAGHGLDHVKRPRLEVGEIDAWTRHTPTRVQAIHPDDRSVRKLGVSPDDLCDFAG